MAIPSGIYAIQNNLLYTALSNLDAATFQVTYQIKLLTTAVFAVILLGKQLTRVKWLSLIVLLIGVVLVQLCTEVNTGPNQASAASTHHQRYWIGMIALLTSAVSSGFAGCYFEGMMKQSHTSLWMRNMQLGAFAIPFSLMALLATDFGVILNGNPLNGFNTVTWCVVLNQALGGLLVSIVVKYADSVLKGFATSISIVLSSAISAVLFEFTPSGQFLVGTMLVIGSVVLYSM
ncbi:nucleotide-sugar transporter [Gaertneriomyces semiglobifer]|nr:nucleotide-sugar transporter [Gaertneriomyces semiglobifer]